MSWIINELDIYLRSFFYAHNNSLGFYEGIKLNDKLQKQVDVIKSVHTDDFLSFVEDRGFFFTIALIDSYLGDVEYHSIREPLLIHPARHLKLFPRALYSLNYIKKALKIDHYYFTRYFPRMLVTTYMQSENGIQRTIGYQNVRGTHVTTDHESLISYNVVDDVDLGTIIEEELHAHRVHVHGVDLTSDLERKIRESSPDITYEIEKVVGIVLEAEKEKFDTLGKNLRNERNDTLEDLEKFIKIYEEKIRALVN